MTLRVDTPIRTRPAVLSIVLAGVFIVLWQVAVLLGVGAGMLPGPGAVATRAITIFRDPFGTNTAVGLGIGLHLLASLLRVASGFGIALSIAVPLGLIIGQSPYLRKVIDPFIQIAKPVSPLAWLPLGLAIFRDGGATAVFVIAISALWPALVATIDAARSVDPNLKKMAATVEASAKDTLLFITLPASWPGIVTGLRQSLATAWLVIIAAEMLVGSRGLGYVLWSEWNALRIDSIIVIIFLIGLIGIALDRAIDSLRGLLPHE